MIDKNRVYWFPMLVTYGRHLKVKEYLDSEQIENFLPMTTRTVKTNGRIRHKRVPAINNLIFVRHTMAKLTDLKQQSAVAAPLRYMTRRTLAAGDAPAEIITVPDSQMENFIKVASGPENEITYLTGKELAGKANGRVTITSGPFAGVHGTIKRIHGNRRVVVELENLGGACINFVPKACMAMEEQPTAL
jgi:transcription antitermination factor NusG